MGEGPAPARFEWHGDQLFTPTVVVSATQVVLQNPELLHSHDSTVALELIFSEAALPAAASQPVTAAHTLCTRALTVSPAQQPQWATVLVQSLVHRSPPPSPGTTAISLSSSTLHSDPVSTVPFSRWDVDAAPARAVDARFGACLSAVDLFDAALLGVSDAEAALLDPQQRLLMEGLHEALAAAAGVLRRPRRVCSS